MTSGMEDVLQVDIAAPLAGQPSVYFQWVDSIHALDDSLSSNHIFDGIHVSLEPINISIENTAIRDDIIPDSQSPSMIGQPLPIAKVLASLPGTNQDTVHPHSDTSARVWIRRPAAFVCAVRR